MDVTTGEWIFRAKHFTRYAVAGANDEEESEEEIKDVEEEKEEKQPEEKKLTYRMRLEEPEEEIPKKQPTEEMENNPEEMEQEKEEIKKSSNMFKVVEDEQPEEIGQLGSTKRKVDNIPTAVDDMMMIGLPEVAEEEKPADNEIETYEADTEFLRVPVSLLSVREFEEKQHHLQMSHSFRVAWRKDGTFTSIGNISKNKGTYQINLNKIRPHKTIENIKEESKNAQEKSYFEIVYGNLLSTLCNNCINNSEMLKNSQDVKSRNLELFAFSLPSPESIPALWKQFVQILTDARQQLDPLITQKLDVEADIWSLMNCLFGNPLIDLSTYRQQHKFVECLKPGKNLSLPLIEVLRKNLLSSWIRNSIPL